MRTLTIALAILITFAGLGVVLVGIPIFIGKMIRTGRGDVAEEQPVRVVNPNLTYRSLFDKPDRP